MAKRASTIPGWERIGTTKGGSGIYRNPQGETVSRRQYENARAQRAGLDNWNAVRKFQAWTKSDPQYNRFAKAAAKAEGKKVSEVKRVGSLFNQYYINAFVDDGTGGKLPRDKVNRSKDGPFRDLMEWVELWDPDTEWDY